MSLSFRPRHDMNEYLLNRLCAPVQQSLPGGDSVCLRARAHEDLLSQLIPILTGHTLWICTHRQPTVSGRLCLESNASLAFSILRARRHWIQWFLIRHPAFPKGGNLGWAGGKERYSLDLRRKHAGRQLHKRSRMAGTKGRKNTHTHTPKNPPNQSFLP